MMRMEGMLDEVLGPAIVGNIVWAQERQQQDKEKSGVNMNTETKHGWVNE